MNVGDLSSTAKGSGARFNAGKPPVDLIPLILIAEGFGYVRGVGTASHIANSGAVTALGELGMFQCGAGIASLHNAFAALGMPWMECASVFDFGRKKYSKRGDCTCSAGDAARLKKSGSIFTPTREPMYESCLAGNSAKAATTSPSKSAIQTTESDKTRIIASGYPTRLIESAPAHRSANEVPSAMPTHGTKKLKSIDASAPHMGLTASNTTHLSPPDAPSAAATIECTSTIAMSEAPSDPRCAIPATLALDLSSGLIAGLNAHLNTCGVHKVVIAADWNWSKGMQWSVPLACAARHLIEMIEGGTEDHDSHLPVVGHVACNLVMLMTFITTYPEGDDRPVATLSAMAAPPKPVVVEPEPAPFKIDGLGDYFMRNGVLANLDFDAINAFGGSHPRTGQFGRYRGSWHTSGAYLDDGTKPLVASEYDIVRKYADSSVYGPLNRTA